jgi:hypothetical protein
MAKTTRLMAGLVLAVSAGAEWPAAAEPTNSERPAGVRSSSALLGAHIELATEQSATFRGLVEAIRASDGIVYVEAGECGHYVRSCLVGVSVAGGFRILWIEVDTDRTDLDLIASIGHELQHAVEILSDSNVRTRNGMYSYYSRRGRRARGPTAFETTAAIHAGDAVRAEIQRAFATEPSATVAS